MCGINGFNFKDTVLIKAMNEKIKYRGPDSSGNLSFDKVTLGQVRLSIIDLSSKANQPMSYFHQGHKLHITFNGEIYNYQELKKELESKKYFFKTDSDTEVILASYLAWGKDCVSKFKGMWAFCIYDQSSEELFLSKDRFGKKPLYYYKDLNKFYFSSEMKTLIPFLFKKEIDKIALEQIFTYRFTFGERTILKGVKNFLPGHNMVFDLKKKKVTLYEKYYSLKIKENKLSFDEAKVKLKELLRESVGLRMVSDVPVASLLSGGLDSSIVTSLAKKLNPELHTFSIGFDTTNELPYAKLVADNLATKHHEIKMDKKSMLNYLDEMIYHMDEPIGADPGFLPIYVLSKEVSKFNKVVLSGDGADEIFTGYDRYKLLEYGNKLKKFVFFKSKNPLLKILYNMKGKSYSESFLEITRVFDKEDLDKLGLNERLPSIKAENLAEIQKFDVENLLPKDFFMKADKMSSGFGLEQRTPFIDYEVLEFAFSLPLEFKLKFWNEKRILKEAFKNEIPKEVYKRRKHGFNVPIDYWFENVLKDKLIKLINTNKHGLYNQSYALELLKDLKGCKLNFKLRNVIAQKLWMILVFEMWYERFM